LFFDGGEQLALKFGLPVYYLELERVKAGVYRHNYTLIYDGNEEVKPHQIMERYVRLLERTIQAKPEHWMWSHRRWKFYPNADSEFYDNYKTKE
jgi:KDO2-lipid IV(A) lauroyltransferase